MGLKRMDGVLLLNSYRVKKKKVDVAVNVAMVDGVVTMVIKVNGALKIADVGAEIAWIVFLVKMNVIVIVCGNGSLLYVMSARKDALNFFFLCQ